MSGVCATPGCELNAGDSGYCRGHRDHITVRTANDNMRETLRALTAAPATMMGAWTDTVSGATFPPLLRVGNDDPLRNINHELHEES